MADISKIQVDSNVYAIKAAETYSKTAATSIVISSTTKDDVMRRDIAGGSGSWSSTYVPTAGFDKQFLLVFVNTSTNNTLTITHPTTGYAKVVNLYGSPTLIIPAGKTGEVAVTIGKDSANATYMSFTCEIEDQGSGGGAGRYIPMTGTTSNSNVTGNVKFNDNLGISWASGDSITGNADELTINATRSNTITLDADEGDITLNGDVEVTLNMTCNGSITSQNATVSNGGTLTVNGTSNMRNTVPQSDLAYNLGTLNQKWAIGYINSVRSATVFASGGVYESSDIRLKDIQGELDLNKAYDLINKCSTILYNIKGDDRIQIGVVAQEVKEFFPEIVNETEDGFLSVDYSRLTVVLLKVLKDLINRVSNLENK